MKVFVTGDAGYLGSQFVKKYQSIFPISGYDLTRGEDILNADQLENAMSGTDMVVHLAAIPKPIDGIPFDKYFTINCIGTLRVLEAAVKIGAKRVIYGSSTTVYGIERGIPFKTPISESTAPLESYADAESLTCRECDMAYHSSKVIAEQLLAQYGLVKKIQAISLRFGPIGKVFLGTSVSDQTATEAIEKAITYAGTLWYEPFTIVDDLPHISNEKAKKILGLSPVKYAYPVEKIHSSLPL